MKIVNIVNIPNYPNYTIYGKDIETLKIYVSDLLPNDSEEYNNEDLCINIIIRCVERNDNVNSIKLQFDNRETYINSALTIISCIRDAHKEIDIMGSCIVY